MSNKKHRSRNAYQEALQKYYGDITVAERKLNHKKLKASALCTHTREPMIPDLSYHEDPQTHKVSWRCRICDDKVDLFRIPEDKLREAIETVNQACNMIKMMSSDSDNDKHLVQDICAEIQFKTRLYLMSAYKSALNRSTKNKQHGRGGNGRRSQPVTWSDGR